MNQRWINNLPQLAQGWKVSCQVLLFLKLQSFKRLFVLILDNVFLSLLDRTNELPEGCLPCYATLLWFSLFVFLAFWWLICCLPRLLSSLLSLILGGFELLQSLKSLFPKLLFHEWLHVHLLQESLKGNLHFDKVPLVYWEWSHELLRFLLLSSFFLKLEQWCLQCVHYAQEVLPPWNDEVECSLFRKERDALPCVEKTHFL